MQDIVHNELEPEPEWKNTKLSLERPYKDDDGNPIQVLLDITQDGQVIYEPILDHETKLGERFRRIFLERGHNFFDTPIEARYGQQLDTKNDTVPTTDEKKETEDTETDGEQKFMTPEQLLKMRWDVLPRLHVALGEMTQARDLLTLLLSTTGSTAQDPTIQALTTGSLSNVPDASLNPALTPGLLTASTVTPLPPIPSVQAFDTELVVGGKDTALRKASEVLRVAAEGIERSMSRTDSFWADALRIRRANWNLVPAPLPIGAPAGKGTDRTSRDFMIYFGLSQSPPAFRRGAIAHMDFYASPSASEAPLVFPHRKRVRLRTALKSQGYSSHSQIIAYSHESLEGAIRDAQKEIVESEIFDELIKEASILPTASTRVSERLIVVDAAQDTELSFELVDEEQVVGSNRAHETHDRSGRAICNLISSALPLLLLRRHDYAKQTRLGQHSVNGNARTVHTPLLPYAKPGQGPQILQPIIDFTQYQVFLGRVKAELERAVERLRFASIEAEIQFRGIGESGGSIVNDLVLGKEKVGGEAILRIDARHNIRFTFSSPSSLTTHLPHATISIASIPQLSQLLADETERSLLSCICAIGVELCQSLSGAWFVDDMMSRAVGRWEGCVLNFRVRCADTQTLDCHAHQLLREKLSASTDPLQTPQRSLDNTGQPKIPVSNTPISNILSYSSRSDKSLGLFAWVKQVIEETLAKS